MRGTQALLRELVPLPASADRPVYIFYKDLTVGAAYAASQGGDTGLLLKVRTSAGALPPASRCHWAFRWGGCVAVSHAGPALTGGQAPHPPALLR